MVTQARSWLAGLAGAIALSVPAIAADSVYTTLDLDACTVLERHEESGGARMVCEGYADTPVYVSEGDLRFDVDYGMPNALWESFGPFNSINDVVEWRTGNGRPHAAILRYFIDTGITGTNDDKGQALVVAKVADGAQIGCVVAVIDAAVEQANGVARGAAAMVAHFQCGDPPIAIGPQGSLAFSFVGAVNQGR